MKKLCKLFNIQREEASAYHQSYDKVEKFIKFIILYKVYKESEYIS